MTLDLGGLTVGPAQVWGGVRLVPLIRAEPVTDLRLRREIYADADGVVDLGREGTYTSYIPHGLIANWTTGGGPAAAFGTQIGPALPECMPLPPHRRLARREARNLLRFLPLHLAMEGYLALHFQGPTIAWREWSQQAIRRGLSPRAEESYVGAAVSGLADALKVFEIHAGQCGIMLYVADSVASTFVAPHPDDYRTLHPTLVQDLFGELIYHYATLMPAVPDFVAVIDDEQVDSLADVRAAAMRQAHEWTHFHDATMALNLLDASYRWSDVHRMGRFTLSRFRPSFHRKRESHIGEAITDESGRIMYLKTYRLSENQIRRGHLLDQLADHHWHLGDTAATLGVTEPQLGLRLESAGFGHLLRPDVLDHYRKATR